MFANLCFQLLDYFNITSNETVKMGIAVFLALLVFALFYFVVKFTNLEIHNLNQNILALLSVDIISFAYLMYKRRQDLQEKIRQEKIQEESQMHEEPQVQETPQNANELQTQETPQNVEVPQVQEVPQTVEEPQIVEEENESKEKEVPYDIEKKVQEIISEESVSKE